MEARFHWYTKLLFSQPETMTVSPRKSVSEPNAMASVVRLAPYPSAGPKV